MEVFLGTASSEGIGIGPAFVIPETAKRVIPQEHIEKKDIDAGWKRMVAASSGVQRDIQSQLDLLGKKAEAAQKEVLETYILMLRDDVFFKELRSFYDAKLCRIEYAIATKAEEYAARLRASGNEYLSERAQDITDIFGRVVDAMLGVKPFDMSRLKEGDVVIASTLNATDMIEISKKRVAGIALSDGGVQSHVAILSRGYGIPCVMALGDIKTCKTGTTVIVDGMKGEVILSPDSNTLAKAQERRQEDARRRRSLKGFKNKPPVTKDGERFCLFANIGTVEEAKKALEEGADGIGLFRTEFLYMSDVDAVKSSTGAHSSYFSEDSQTAAYKSVLQLMKGREVTIRTLDAGGDKVLRPTDVLSNGEKNPLMGLRAVRLSLKRPKMLCTQLRALYRASPYGNLRIMFPLITDVTQVRQCKAIAAQAAAELKDEGIEINENVPLGIMVETASAAITSDVLAKECDFFSLGTNDLTQYTLAVDRENDSVAGLYDETNLAVLRLIEMTIRNALAAKIDVCVCGEMAGRADTMTLLAGMGVRRLSMASSLIAQAKELLLHYTLEDLKALANKGLSI